MFPVTTDTGTVSADGKEWKFTIKDGVKWEDGQAVTNVTITSPGLDAESLGLLANRGTPVVAIMSLRDDGPLAGPTQAMLAFLTKIGVR